MRIQTIDKVELAQRGVHFMTRGDLQLISAELRSKLARLANDAALANDAQIQMITTANAGIPAVLTNYVDPKWIKVLFAPTRAVELYTETKLGDWAMDVTTFKVGEDVGETSAYGDWSNDGKSTFNTDFPTRQNYRAQSIISYGDLELERAGLAQLDLAEAKKMSAINTMKRFQNDMYLYGIDGLKNYGIINEPNLSAPITPTVEWTTATPDQIVNDFVRLFIQLVSQTDGIVDNDAVLRVGISPLNYENIGRTNMYGINALKLIKERYPNLTFIKVPQFTTSAGELIQLIAVKEGETETGICCFSEKLRAHPVIPELSAFKQKTSSGGWGFVLQRPMMVAQMLG